MDSEFRQLDARERGLLEKLLEADFSGRDELRTQLDSLTAKQIEEDGTLSLRCGSGRPSPRKYKLPFEGICKDAGSPIINPPTARDMENLLPVCGGRREGQG